ncbi:MAG TPA: ATP-grasp domain-containing protein [Noviherbaspirillum sp.]|nr:ATP-grasp domain-containing protein [Noviherbaspirillum sp.]
MEKQSLRCVVMNRWCDEFSAYERYIDHTLHRVAYIVTPEGATVLDNKPSLHVVIVPDFKDLAVLSAAVAECHQVLGGIDRLISLSEFDLTVTGELRAIHDIPGDRPHEVARFRDKTVMKNRVLAAQLRAPRFIAMDARSTTMEALHTLRYPLIVKPRSGAASAGVHRIATREELEHLLPNLPLSEYECEEFISGPIYHVDGLVSGGESRFQKASRYLGTCLDFAHGKPLGSIVLAESEFQAELLKFTDACLRALDLRQGAFHMEIISADDGFYFLEVGARVGGGEIPFTMRDVFGIDMYANWVRQQLDPEFQAQPKEEDGMLAGFLIIPEPVGKRLLEATIPDGIETLYASLVPPVGHVFDGDGGYDTILGRFRYCGKSEAQIEADIHETIRRFSYRLEDAFTTAEATCTATIGQ